MAHPRIGKSDRIAIIGLGRFGTSVAQTLHSLRYEVTAIDRDPARVEAAASFSSLAAQGDATEKELLESLDVDRSDVAIVSLSGNLEASILTTLQLKRLGVPYVVSKAQTEPHAEVLRRIGADKVIQPEAEAGVRLGRSLAVPSINDYISLSHTSGVAKFAVPAHFTGRTIGDIYSMCGAKLSVLLLRRAQTMIVSPSLNEEIESGDEFVVAGPDVEIETFVETIPTTE